MQANGLRPIVEALDREMSRFAAGASTGAADPTALLASWARLLEFLALGPSPEARACPSCGSVAVASAARCGTCWRKLASPPPFAAA